MIKPWFSFKLFLMFFLLLRIVIAGVVFSISENEKSNQLNIIESQQKYVIEKNFTFLEDVFTQAREDVLYLLDYQN
ncbi:MAG: hypothetical protein U9R28_11300 [Pseudomonadota bacterium]|nr:hypothetical protein [Pseudomonadota bacterium]